MFNRARDHCGGSTEARVTARGERSGAKGIRLEHRNGPRASNE